MVGVTRLAVAILGEEFFGIGRGLADIAVHLVLEFIVGKGVGRALETGRVLEAEGIVVRNARALVLTLLGGHDDDTVGRVQAVDGGGGILQDGNALNVLGVELGEVGGTVAGDTVDDHERGAVATDGDHVVEGTRLTGFLTDQQTWHLALEVVDEVFGLGGLDVVGGDGRDGTGQGFLALNAVTDDDNVFKHFRIFRHDHAHVGGSGDFLGGVADR